MSVNDIARDNTGLSIVQMLARVAVAKNAENRELLKTPVRQADSPEAKAVESILKDQPGASVDGKTDGPPGADDTKLVDVIV